jgi:hypothetical protein
MRQPTLWPLIHTRKVQCPTFIQTPPVTDTPDVMGLSSAREHMCRLAQNLWGVEHEYSIFIGTLE